MTDLLARNEKPGIGDPNNVLSNDVRPRNTDLQEITSLKEKLTISNPFLEDIVKFQMPKNFVLPTMLKSYEGFGDPCIHLTKFQSMIFFNSAAGPILCRSFSTFLDGAALFWFFKLPAGSISCVEELARSFIDYFAASKIYIHESDYLSIIKQGQHGSLKDYIARFTKATMDIPDLSPEVHLHALKNGFCPGKFQETIAVTKPAENTGRILRKKPRDKWRSKNSMKLNAWKNNNRTEMKKDCPNLKPRTSKNPSS
nr:uncharacterized protein LOC112708794 [Arachis hypogaea]